MRDKTDELLEVYEDRELWPGHTGNALEIPEKVTFFQEGGVYGHAGWGYTFSVTLTHAEEVKQGRTFASIWLDHKI